MSPEYRRVHDLLALARQVKEHGFALKEHEGDLGSLEQYAVEVRYPGATATPAEAKKALAAMERVVKPAPALGIRSSGSP